MKSPYAIISPSLDNKWRKAVAYLGRKWVLHPQSTYKPRWCAFKV